jgi:AcrR family transcriptional regulator
MPASLKSQARASNGAEGARTVAIYYKAAKIFLEQGYDATSMDDIAEALQITKAGLYYYIESKEELLYQIISHGLDWLEKEVIKPARGLADPEARLRWIIEHHGRGLLKGSRVIPLLTDEVSALSARHRQQILGRKRAYFDLVRGTLNELKRQDKLRDIDTTAAAFGLFGMLLWLPRWYRPGGRMSAAQTLEHIRNLYLSGVLEAAKTKPTPAGRKMRADRTETATTLTRRK